MVGELIIPSQVPLAVRIEKPEENGMRTVASVPDETNVSEPEELKIIPVEDAPEKVTAPLAAKVPERDALFNITGVWKDTVCERVPV